MAAEDFFIGGDINIELKLETSGEYLQGLDGIDWYGIHGPECRRVSRIILENAALGGPGDLVSERNKSTVFLGFAIFNLRRGT